MDKQKDAIVLAGATGFLGQHVYRELLNRGYSRVVAIVNKSVMPDWMFRGEWERVDLTDYRQASKIFRSNKQIKNVKGVINLAASVGGIGANQEHSAEFMMDSLAIGTNLLRAVMHNRSFKDGGKFVQIGTVCAYPKYTPVPFREEYLWQGYPEETNAPYGIAKRTLMELVKTYNKQYKGKFRGINLVPVNLYGPGDNFDPKSSHVIPALIRKFDDAISNNQTKVTLWGTGTATREFLYVADAAQGIVDAFEKYDGLEPVNLGTGQEISISALAVMIAALMKFDGDIIFDPSKPDGQPRRCLDVSRAAEEFGFRASTTFVDGLKHTINWWEANKVWIE